MRVFRAGRTCIRPASLIPEPAVAPASQRGPPPILATPIWKPAAAFPEAFTRQMTEPKGKAGLLPSPGQL